MSDLSNWPPGKLGSGILLDIDMMPDSEKSRRTALFERHAFEEYVSEMIPFDRSLIDARDTDFCRRRYGEDEDTYGLEPTSVIICFHNEV